jgi:hypothetical protein
MLPVYAGQYCTERLGNGCCREGSSIRTDESMLGEATETGSQGKLTYLLVTWVQNALRYLCGTDDLYCSRQRNATIRPCEGRPRASARELIRDYLWRIGGFKHLADVGPAHARSTS